jgi:hypothetical protein
VGLECPNAWRPGLGQQPSPAGQEALPQWLAVEERQETAASGHGAMGKERTMCHSHEARSRRSTWIGMLMLLAAPLVASAGPGYARGGGHRGANMATTSFTSVGNEAGSPQLFW